MAALPTGQDRGVGVGEGGDDVVGAAVGEGLRVGDGVGVAQALS